MKKNDYYSTENHELFEHLTRFSRKNIYLIIKNKLILENEGFNFCNKLKGENKLKNFNTKDLNNVINKIYNYIINNKENLLKKYGNRGKYREDVKNCKNLKQKQKTSAKTAAFENSLKHSLLVKKTIENLLKTTLKITINLICETGNLSNKTVIKHYKNFKNEIKEHNLSLKTAL